MAIGEKFTVTPAPDKDKLENDSNLELNNSGSTQELKFHSSCSKVLAVGDMFGTITLVGFTPGESTTTQRTWIYKSY